MGKLKLGILGSGYLGGIIARAWKQGFLPEYELIGIVGRSEEKTSSLASEIGCKACSNIHELIEMNPDYIAEAASVEAVREFAIEALGEKINIVVLSIGAFADDEFYKTVQNVALEHGSKVYIASGAVGGFDVLRTITLMGKAKAGIETTKSLESLRKTPLFKEELMNDSNKSVVFSGNAKEAIALLPTKVNVAVATSLATIGPENTNVTINSVPKFIGDDHKITAEIDGVKAVVDIYSSTSEIAGWSVVAVLQNIVSPIVF